jgi:hypothetical protein
VAAAAAAAWTRNTCRGRVRPGSTAEGVDAVDYDSAEGALAAADGAGAGGAGGGILCLIRLAYCT